MRVAPEVKLSDEQRQELEKRACGRTVTVRAAQRAKMILMAASGLTDSAVGKTLGISRQNVARWRCRFIPGGLPGIEKDAPRPGRKPQISSQRTQEIVALTTREKPADATHWSTSSMAQATGISEASVRRIWKKHGLKPHLLRTFKLSNDPLFAEKWLTLSVFISIPQNMRWCFQLTKRARSKRWTAPTGIAAEEGSGRNHDP